MRNEIQRWRTHRDQDDSTVTVNWYIDGRMTLEEFMNQLAERAPGKRYHEVSLVPSHVIWQDAPTEEELQQWADWAARHQQRSQEYRDRMYRELWEENQGQPPKEDA